MHEVAVVSVVGANPVKTVDILLDSLHEMLASDDSVGHLGNPGSGVSVDVDIG